KFGPFKLRYKLFRSFSVAALIPSPTPSSSSSQDGLGHGWDVVPPGAGAGVRGPQSPPPKGRPQKKSDRACSHPWSAANPIVTTSPMRDNLRSALMRFPSPAKSTGTGPVVNQFDG